MRVSGGVGLGVSGEDGYQHATPSPLLFPILFPTFPLVLRGAVQSTHICINVGGSGGARATSTKLENNILFPREIPFALTCIVVVHRGFASQPLAGAGLAVDWYVMVAVVVGSVVSGSCTSRASLMLLSSSDLMCLFLPLL